MSSDVQTVVVRLSDISESVLERAVTTRLGDVVAHGAEGRAFEAVFIKALHLLRLPFEESMGATAAVWDIKPNGPGWNKLLADAHVNLKVKGTRWLFTARAVYDAMKAGAANVRAGTWTAARAEAHVERVVRDTFKAKGIVGTAFLKPKDTTTQTAIDTAVRKKNVDALRALFMGRNFSIKKLGRSFDVKVSVDWTGFDCESEPACVTSATKREGSWQRTAKVFVSGGVRAAPFEIRTETKWNRDPRRGVVYPNIIFRDAAPEDSRPHQAVLTSAPLAERAVEPERMQEWTAEAIDAESNAVRNSARRAGLRRAKKMAPAWSKAVRAANVGLAATNDLYRVVEYLHTNVADWDEAVKAGEPTGAFIPSLAIQAMLTDVAPLLRRMAVSLEAVRVFVGAHNAYIKPYRDMEDYQGIVKNWDSLVNPHVAAGLGDIRSWVAYAKRMDPTTIPTEVRDLFNTVGGFRVGHFALAAELMPYVYSMVSDVKAQVQRAIEQDKPMEPVLTKKPKDEPWTFAMGRKVLVWAKAALKPTPVRDLPPAARDVLKALSFADKRMSAVMEKWEALRRVQHTDSREWSDAALRAHHAGQPTPRADIARVEKRAGMVVDVMLMIADLPPVLTLLAPLMTIEGEEGAYGGPLERIVTAVRNVGRMSNAGDPRAAHEWREMVKPRITEVNMLRGAKAPEVQDHLRNALATAEGVLEEVWRGSPSRTVFPEMADGVAVAAKLIPFMFAAAEVRAQANPADMEIALGKMGPWDVRLWVTGGWLRANRDKRPADVGVDREQAAAFVKQAAALAYKLYRGVGVKDRALAGPLVVKWRDPEDAFDKRHAAGYYAMTTNLVVVYADELGVAGAWDVGTQDATWILIHELAHRVYYRGLTTNARNYWHHLISKMGDPMTTLIKSACIAIAMRDTDEVCTASKDCNIVGSFDNSTIRVDGLGEFDREMLLRRVPAKDVGFAETIWWWYKNRWPHKQFIDWLNAKRYTKELPTEYANVTPVEAWPDAVANTLLRRPRTKELRNTSEFVRAVVHRLLGQVRESVEESVYSRAMERLVPLASLTEGREALIECLRAAGLDEAAFSETSVAVSLRVPSNVARQFPDKKGDIDPTPPHVTVLVVGDAPVEKWEQVRAVVAKLAGETRPFRVSMHEYGEFKPKPNDPAFTVAHMKIDSPALARWRVQLMSALGAAGVTFENKFPHFKPHVTLAYGSEPYTGKRPTGAWEVGEVEAWRGTRTKLRFTLGVLAQEPKKLAAAREFAVPAPLFEATVDERGPVDWIRAKLRNVVRMREELPALLARTKDAKAVYVRPERMSQWHFYVFHSPRADCKPVQVSYLTTDRRYVPDYLEPKALKSNEPFPIGHDCVRSVEAGLRFLWKRHGPLRLVQMSESLAEDGDDAPSVDSFRVRTSGDANIRGMLQHIQDVAKVGHSFSVVVDPDDSEYRRTFGVDGDGHDRVEVTDEARTVLVPLATVCAPLDERGPEPLTKWNEKHKLPVLWSALRNTLVLDLLPKLYAMNKQLKALDAMPDSPRYRSALKKALDALSDPTLNRWMEELPRKLVDTVREAAKEARQHNMLTADQVQMVYEKANTFITTIANAGLLPTYPPAHFAKTYREELAKGWNVFTRKYGNAGHAELFLKMFFGDKNVREADEAIGDFINFISTLTTEIEANRDKVAAATALTQIGKVGAWRLAVLGDFPAEEVERFERAARDAWKRLKALGAADRHLAGPVILRPWGIGRGGGYYSAGGARPMAGGSDIAAIEASPGALPDYDRVRYVIIHEVGHRLYFKGLSNKGRRVWDEFIDSQGEPWPRGKLIKMLATVSELRPALAAKFGLDANDIDRADQQATGEERSIARLFWGRWMWGNPTKTPAQFVEWIETKRYTHTLPTEYANTSAIEAWPEVVTDLALARIKPGGAGDTGWYVLDAFRAALGTLKESLEERAVVLGDQALRPHLEAARQALEAYVQADAKQRGGEHGSMRGLLQRHIARLVSIKPTTSYKETQFEFAFTPRGGGSGVMRKTFPEASYEWDVPRKFVTWRTPKNNLVVTQRDAYKSIPARPDMAYRGMSIEEWLITKRRGFVQSAGTHNLGDEQQNLTFFGTDPATGAHYSAGFAPIQFQPTRKRPGVVIAVPRDLLLTAKDRPKAIPSSELAYEGQLDLKHVKGVWFVIPGEYSTGRMTLTVDAWNPAHPKFSTDWSGRLAPAEYAIVDMTKRELGESVYESAPTGDVVETSRADIAEPFVHPLWRGVSKRKKTFVKTVDEAPRLREDSSADVADVFAVLMHAFEDGVWDGLPWDDLSQRVRLPKPRLKGAIDTLVSRGKAVRSKGADGVVRFRVRPGAEKAADAKSTLADGQPRAVLVALDALRAD